MFYAAYVFSELRRRSGRTILTALGLALGVGLVVTTTALSAGLDRAQDDVLRPLTGVGTDMTVTRPIGIILTPAAAASRSSPRRSGGSSGRRTDHAASGCGPRRTGDKFSQDDFVAATQLSFEDDAVSKIAALAGVSSAAVG